jgi:hypothetical protein
MSHENGSGVHSEKGVEGLGMAAAHKFSRKAAEVIARLPFIVALVRTWDSTGGVATGTALRGLAGWFNLPIAGPWGSRINSFFDALVYEVAEILEKDADRPIEDLLKDDSFMHSLNEKAESFFRKEVLVALEEVHSDENCSRLKLLTAAESYKDKDGKEHKKAGRFPVVKMGLDRAIRKRIGFCFECYPMGAPVAESHAPKKEASKKVSPAEICGAYIEEAKDDLTERAKREAQVAQLWMAVHLIQDEDLRGRIDGLNTRAELTTLLTSLAHGQKPFEQAMLQLEEPGMSRAVAKITRDIRRGLENGIEGLNEAAKPLIEEIDAETAAVRKRMNERKGAATLDKDGNEEAKMDRPNRFVRFWRTLTEGLV